jgi:long-chain acyl-CoA synthetase
VHPLHLFLASCDAAPDEAIVLQGDIVYSRRDLCTLAGNLTVGLEAHGVNAETNARILIVLPNSVDLIALIIATWSLGGLPMLLSPKSTEQQQTLIEQNHRPALSVDVKRSSLLKEHKGEIGDIRPTADDDASVIFTSGSTGAPKGVVQTGSTLTSGSTRVAQSLAYRRREHILVPIPFAHDYGWGQVLSSLVGQHCLVLPEREILPDVTRAINQHRPSVFAGVPSLYAALLFGISGFEKADISSLRIFSATGSVFAPKIRTALQDRAPDAKIYSNYGLTETYRTACLAPSDSTDHDGTVGKAISGVQIKVMRPNGSDCAIGERGEIVHIGEGVFDRYLDDLENTDKIRTQVDSKPAVMTGDIGVLDKYGFLTIVGRQDRLIKSMDIRINLADIEDAYAMLDGVYSVAVLGTPNLELATVVLTAIVVLETNANAQHVRRAANKTLAPHMRARQIIVVDELPRTPLGKVDYPALQTLIPSLT